MSQLTQRQLVFAALVVCLSGAALLGRSRTLERRPPDPPFLLQTSKTVPLLPLPDGGALPHGKERVVVEDILDGEPFSLKIFLPFQGPLDVNEAPEETLALLRGVGPVRAKAIVCFREEFGPFARVEDLVWVLGMKEETVRALEGLLVVNGGG